MIRRAFYRSANAIFGKVGRVASEEVVLQLIKTKCIPSLLYGLEACSLVKSELSSLDFVVNRFFYSSFPLVTNSISLLSFFPRTISEWDKRTQDVRSKPSMASFRSALLIDPGPVENNF